MIKIMKIKIAVEYTDTPGGRYISDGPYSGEDFRKNVLEIKYRECLEKHEKLEIDFDGGYGYGTSFLEEAFGGLVREGYDADEIIENMIFISEEENSLIDRVRKYILDMKVKK